MFILLDIYPLSTADIGRVYVVGVVFNHFNNLGILATVSQSWWVSESDVPIDYVMTHI